MEFADQQSPGCAEHHDPACLCDVDLSRTEGIAWNQAPRELLGVETAEGLVDAAAEMLMRLQIQMTFKDANPDHVGSLRTVLEEAPYARDMVRALGDRSRSVEEICASFGYRNSNIYALLSAALGNRAPKGYPAWVRQLAIDMAKDGHTVREILDELARRGHPAQETTVRQWLHRGGVRAADRWEADRMARWPKLKALLDQGYSQREAAKALGVSRGTVEVDIARARRRGDLKEKGAA